MSGGPRDYGVGTERALFRMAEGTCYFPGCSTPVISVEDGHPIVGVEIAHIRGAKPKAARYDPTMTDADRAAYANLILLCVPHHKLVDRIEPEKYSVEMLSGWKAENEPEDGVDSLRTLVTETNLETLLEEVVQQLRPQRSVELDLTAGIITGPDGVMSMPLELLSTVLEHNQHLSANPRVIIVNVRNVGNVDVSVASIDVHFVIDVPESPGSADFSLLGRNDFGASNPPLPYRLRDGESVQWFTKLETATMIIKTIEAQSRSVSALRARVRLGSGEDVLSDDVPWPGELSLG